MDGQSQYQLWNIFLKVSGRVFVRDLLKSSYTHSGFFFSSKLLSNSINDLCILFEHLWLYKQFEKVSSNTVLIKKSRFKNQKYNVYYDL